MFNNINDLNETDRELLESVLRKDKEELTQYDISILNARRSYLNYPQRQAYKDIIIQDEAPLDEDPSQQQQVSNETLAQGAPTEPPVIPTQAEQASTTEAPPENPEATSAEEDYGVTDPNTLA